MKDIKIFCNEDLVTTISVEDQEIINAYRSKNDIELDIKRVIKDAVDNIITSYQSKLFKTWMIKFTEPARGLDSAPLGKKDKFYLIKSQPDYKTYDERNKQTDKGD